MNKLFSHGKGQSILEYTTLVIIIAAALAAMFTYMRRSVNVKLKQIQVELDESKR